MDDLSLVEAVDRFGERIVVGIADAADRRFDARFGQALRVSSADVLRTSVRMMHEAGSVPAVVRAGPAPAHRARS